MLKSHTFNFLKDLLFYELVIAHYNRNVFEMAKTFENVLSIYPCRMGTQFSSFICYFSLTVNLRYTLLTGFSF